MYNSRVKTTRQRILEYLQDRRHASAEDLSLALQVTAANIRHHLSVLASEDVVEVIGKRSPRSARGRPVQIYALRQQTALHNLDQLASALLRCAFKPGQDTQNLLRKLAQELVGPSLPVSRTQTQKLTQTVEALNKMNYQARWEAHAAGPRLILSHCPYLQILEKHPELCTLDAYLLEEMLGMDARLLARRLPNRNGLPQCIFALSPKAGPSAR